MIDTDDVCTESNLQVLHPTFYRPAEEKAEVTSEVIAISETKTTWSITLLFFNELTLFDALLLSHSRF